MTSFWDTLPRPFFVSAPMADVTDPAFRALIAKVGKPDVMFTEFTSADGLYHTREHVEGGKNTALYATDAENPLMRDLQFTDAERPIVAHIFSSKPDMIAYGAALAEKLGFDGIDINMGCPDRAIERQGAGACLIKTPDVAQALIKAAKGATKLPISVKTRIGYNKNDIEEWIPAILSAKPAALSVHLRTRKEMSLVPAHWDLLPRIIELRNELAPEVRIIGNGDVKSLEEAKEKAVQYGCDGIMMGRGLFGNPWLFAGRKAEETPIKEKLETLIELANAFEKLSPPKHFAILKKHIKAFVTDFPEAANLRAKLMETKSADELSRVIAENPVY